MNRLIKFWSECKYDGFMLGLYFFTLAYMIKFYDVQSFDIKVHNFLLLDYLKEGYFPSPPGYYGAIFLLDKLIWYKYPLVLSALLILTASFWWKYHLSFTWIQESLQLKKNLTFFLTLSLLFLSPIFIPSIDGSYWYLGKFTPTIWHNSTLIAVFPFCILLVRETLDWLENPQRKKLINLLALSVLIMLIKPSFLFCYIPAFPIYAWLQNPREKKRLFTSLGLSGIVLFLLFLEKKWIFDLDPMIAKMYSPEERSDVVINPFRVHLHFSKEPFFDFLTSFPTTSVFLAFWGKKAFRSRFFGFSFLLLGFALAVYLILAETGFRELHGNFYWQIPVALFLHYLSMLIFVGEDFMESGRKMKLGFVLFCLMYLVQFSFGIAYWHRLFFGHALN
ncbi:hypothetical protein [Algoriphagus sp. AK58]|uniref:hypothetical protein n=1 Tax=Algoriphagus sp. AK58 TaxID=1406877 RepID=UPI00164FA85D|nr:hypothetical protein [Algoriphagus sp. AK58]MBC6367509.1 hypothetical protein [Algoriphagus sp. AK58]